MLYLGRRPLFIGKKFITNSKMKNDWVGGLYVKDSCLVRYPLQVTSTARDRHMDRIYDWLNYRNNAIGGTVPSGGFEVEATFIPLRDDGWYALWGTRVGTTGKVTRTNVLIESTGEMSQGTSCQPSGNIAQGESVIGRKITTRYICLPTTSDLYAHAYSSRLIVTDANTGEVLSDNTEIFGDNFTSDAMFSTYTNFYKFHNAWFSRNRYANPMQNASTGADFEGIFFGGAIYINPTGEDSGVITRFPVQYMTPAKKGIQIQLKMRNSSQEVVSYIPESDGVVYETSEIGNAADEVELLYYGMMENCPNFTDSKLIYID